MGDCIMAFWNAPLDITDHRKKAIGSALRMVDSLKDLNVELAKRIKCLSILVLASTQVRS